MILRSIPIILLALPLMACDGMDLGPDGGDEAGGGPGYTGPGGDDGTLNGGSTAASGGDGQDTPTADMNDGGGPQSIQACEYAPGSKVDISLHGHPSMAAAQYARAALLSDAHVVPATELIRSEDFLAYYGLTFHEGLPIDPVSLRWYQVGKAEAGNVDAAMELDFGTLPRTREPLRVVLLLDVSQSLSQSLDLEMATLRSLAKGFVTDGVPGDSLAVLTFAGDVKTEIDAGIDGNAGEYGGLPIDTVALAPRSGNDFKSAVSAALTAADTGGSVLGHVLLVSDGGTTIQEKLLSEIRSAASKGTRFSVAQIGVPLPTGPAPIDLEFLDQLAAAGRGATYYLGGPIDATRAFEQRFGASFGVHARGVVAHIELPPFLQAVGLPEQGVGMNSGPLGGVVGSGTLTPLRLGMRAGCTTIFDVTENSDLPVEPFKISIESTSGELLPLTEFPFVGTRGADAVSVRNDAILATALAIRSKNPVDIERARELLGLTMNGNCLGCDDLMELMSLLERIE
ncbi:MAG: VWA domain-containing protein [Polyangiaceae bacterium]|nr:VWA domain-containing protein [Polyangiaceae bacterium]